MRINVPENQTTSQFIASLTTEAIADMASDQGYGDPHTKADVISKHHKLKRQEELNTLLGERRELGSYALLALGDGTVVREDELIRT